MKRQNKPTVQLIGSALALGALSTFASATYLTVINTFICDMAISFKLMGNSIAIVMFVYGAAKYIYTADDPGGRKQAMSICIACIVALLIIQATSGVIGQIGDAIIASGTANVNNPCPGI
jgi:hypothetical protein